MSESTTLIEASTNCSPCSEHFRPSELRRPILLDARFAMAHLIVDCTNLNVAICCRPEVCTTFSFRGSTRTNGTWTAFKLLFHIHPQGGSCKALPARAETSKTNVQTVVPDTIKLPTRLESDELPTTFQCLRKASRLVSCFALPGQVLAGCKDQKYIWFVVRQQVNVLAFDRLRRFSVACAK